MPVEISTFQLPGGARCVQVVTTGHYSLEDAQNVLRHTGRGGPMQGLPRLFLTQKQTSISPEARRLFASRTDQSEDNVWMAVVVTSAVIRVSTNFILRMNRNDKVRLFSSEPAAIQWLDERARENAARAT